MSIVEVPAVGLAEACRPFNDLEIGESHAAIFLLDASTGD